MMERLRALRAELFAWLAKLSPRERVMVSAAAGAVALFLVWVISLEIGRGLTAREHHIEDKTRVLAQISKLAEVYRARQAQRQQLEARLKGSPVQLLSYISQQGAQQQVEVGDLRPTPPSGELEGLREDAVEVNLARVELGRLAHFLQSLERGQGVVMVRRLRITARADDPNLVDATFTVAAYQLKG
jgi:general secretion pathway protein M